MAPTDQLQEVKIMLHGTAASEGIGIGKVMLIEEHSLEYTPRTVTDTEAESQRFKAAVDAFCYNTEKQAENLRSSAGEKEAEILAGHIQIIKDPYLSGEIEKLIADGQCAESALEHMCDMFIAMFSAADDELTKQRAADVREDMDEYTSPLDELFERLEMRDPDHIAVKYYKDYHSGSAKTLKSIQITLAARLEKFNLSSWLR